MYNGIIISVILYNFACQEKLKWQKEQEEFNRRKREHEIQLVEIERQEVQRREEEVRRRNEDLDDKRRKHRLIQDAVAEQVYD